MSINVLNRIIPGCVTGALDDESCRVILMDGLTAYEYEMPSDILINAGLEEGSLFEMGEMTEEDGKLSYRFSPVSKESAKDNNKKVTYFIKKEKI